MNTEVGDPLLARVRKLLAKAEDPGCTPAEAEALTDKAAQLIAKYGVDRAMLAAAVRGLRAQAERATAGAAWAAGPGQPG